MRILVWFYHCNDLQYHVHSITRAINEMVKVEDVYDTFYDGALSRTGVIINLEDNSYGRFILNGGVLLGQSFSYTLFNGAYHTSYHIFTIRPIPSN